VRPPYFILHRGGADNHGVNRKSVSISGVAHPVFNRLSLESISRKHYSPVY